MFGDFPRSVEDLREMLVTDDVFWPHDGHGDDGRLLEGP